MSQVEAARLYVAALKSQSKKDVFDRWVALHTHGRVTPCAAIREQRKSWMIYDLVRDQYGEQVANEVA